VQRTKLLAVCALSAGLLTACAPVYWLGVRLYYDKVAIPPHRVVMNVGYDPSDRADHKRQLDLYLPEGRGWPSVVFIHGGGWAWGDRSQKFGGADVYGNIGRFLASQGFGAAVISYRLIWPTDWRTQATDVARAVAWVQQNIGARAGDHRRIFLFGHSAGAQLAMRVAIDSRWLTSVGGRGQDICGVVAVSGAGYDMEDREREPLEEDGSYFGQRFGGSVQEDPLDPATTAWRREASVLPLVDANDPPVLSMLADGDLPLVHWQTRLADARLRQLGLSRGLVVVPDTNHEKMVIELSRPDHVAGPAVLEFLRETPCPRPAGNAQSSR
jgi:acetyl esterase/lipase